VSAWLGRTLACAGVDLAYLAIGGATAVLGFVVWVTAVSVTIPLLVFVVGLPLFLLSAVAFRWTAELDRRNAALALGTPLRGHYRDLGGEGVLGRLSGTAGDPQTWKDLAWLVLHSFVGFVFGVLAVSLVAQAVAVALLPAWYWAIEGGADLGVFHVESLGEAFAIAPLALPLAAIAVALLRGMAIAESRLAALLLDAGAGADADAGGRRPREGARRHFRAPERRLGADRRRLLRGLDRQRRRLVLARAGDDRPGDPARLPRRPGGGAAGPGTQPRPRRPGRDLGRGGGGDDLDLGARRRSVLADLGPPRPPRRPRPPPPRRGDVAARLPRRPRA
jgi:hypothetical protein